MYLNEKAVVESYHVHVLLLVFSLMDQVQKVAFDLQQQKKRDRKREREGEKKRRKKRSRKRGIKVNRRTEATYLNVGHWAC